MSAKREDRVRQEDVPKRRCWKKDPVCGAYLARIIMSWKRKSELEDELELNSRATAAKHLLAPDRSCTIFWSNPYGESLVSKDSG